MRIVYLHQYFLTPDMAGGTRSFEMARRLVARGHEVHMITSDQGGTGPRWRRSVEAGIDVHWAGVRYDNAMSRGARMRAFARFAARATARALTLPADVIFATSTPLTIAIPGLIASSLKRIPFVFEVRDMWPAVPIALGAIRHPLAVRAAHWLERAAYGGAARIVALAPGMRDEIVATGVDPDRIAVIPNGCDLELFGQAAGPSPRQTHPWLGTRDMVLFAGTVGRISGVDYFVRLAAATARLDPGIRFVIIGTGGERDAVRALAVRLGVLGENLFMLDPMPKREVAAWYRAADMVAALFTGPPVAWRNAVQNKFFDALAAARPVANNFDGWQTRIALEADVGIMLDPDDATAAADSLVAALRNPEWRAGVPDRALRLARERFDRDVLAGQLESVLLQAVGTGGDS